MHFLRWGLISVTKSKLAGSVGKAREETKTALQTVYDALNKGQRQKLLKDPKVLALLQLYGLKIEER